MIPVHVQTIQMIVPSSLCLLSMNPSKQGEYRDYMKPEAMVGALSNPGEDFFSRAAGDRRYRPRQGRVSALNIFHTDICQHPQ